MEKAIKLAPNGRNRLGDLVGCMVAREEKAEPRRPLRHTWGQDRKGVDAVSEEAFRKSHCTQRIADDYGNDGDAPARADIQPACASQRREQRAVVLKLPHALWFERHDAERLCGGDGGRHGHAYAVNETGRHTLEIVHENAATCDVAATADQRLRQRAEPDVDAGWIDPCMFEYATPRCP